MKIRRGRAEDVALLSTLGRDSFVATFQHLYRPEDLVAFLTQTHSPEAVAGDLAKPEVVYLVAEEVGVPVGYAKLVLAPGWPADARGEQAIELKQLYAVAGGTGRGVGAALMEQVFAEARRAGADEIQLSVWQHNHGAQRFYARYGFERIADIQFRVGDQLDDEFLFAAMV